MFAIMMAKVGKGGVAFVSEIVPKPIIATMANVLYNEHYSTALMRHSIVENKDDLNVAYYWKKRNLPLNSIIVKAANNLHSIANGSTEEFIFEHYYGYNQLNLTTTIEYAVEHPRWQVYPVEAFTLDCSVATLYGAEFVPFIQGKPHSVFLAKGSEVVIRKPEFIRQSDF